MLSAPIVAPVNVVVVLLISIGVLKLASLDFCHLITEPNCPERIKSAGCMPEHIVCEEDNEPPKVGMFKINRFEKVSIGNPIKVSLT